MKRLVTCRRRRRPVAVSLVSMLFLSWSNTNWGGGDLGGSVSGFDVAVHHQSPAATAAAYNTNNINSPLSSNNNNHNTNRRRNHFCRISPKNKRATRKTTTTRINLYNDGHATQFRTEVHRNRRGIHLLRIRGDKDPGSGMTTLFATAPSPNNNNNNNNGGGEPLNFPSDSINNNSPAINQPANEETASINSLINNSNNYTNNHFSLWRQFIRWLAELSLADYQWRSNLFKTNQADRMVEEALARMQGETATYVRPMDAPTRPLRPLGQWESASVAWLSLVMEEEGRRAQRIVDAAGRLIRPSENTAFSVNNANNSKNTADPTVLTAAVVTDNSTTLLNSGNAIVAAEEEFLGPLGRLEKTVVEFLAQIQRAEKERVRTNTLRPKDLDERFRGPLGQLEWEAVQTLEDIRASEILRGQQIKSRGGEIVRPIDVPGPLGEWEMKVSEVIQAEKRRFRERDRNAGRMVRPKDSTWQGPLGEAEATAFETLQSVSTEEMERLRNIQRSLAEKRPMETNRTSFLGSAEALVVGLLRAPALLIGVVNRVRELLSSSKLSDADQDILRHKLEQNDSTAGTTRTQPEQ